METAMNKEKMNQQEPKQEKDDDDDVTKRRRLVLVSGPYQGHVNPLFHLATILHARGFSITIAHTTFSFPETSSHPEFTFLPLAGGSPDETPSSDGLIAAIFHVNNTCEAPLREILVKIDDLVCVIFDELMYFADSVAESLNVPRILLRTASVATLDARLTAVKFKEEGRVPVPEFMMNELVPEIRPLRHRDIQFWVSRIGESLGETITNVSAIRANAIIINTVDCLESKNLVKLMHQRQEPIFAIGPLHKLVPVTSSFPSSSLFEEDKSCIEWLDTQATSSVLYISTGSIATMEGTDVEEMFCGLITSDKPFLWVIRPQSATQIPFILPEGSKGKIVKWAPQKEVLAHRAVGAFWSHCGWNSTLESLSEGVPMICRPSYADQFGNAMYVSQVWNVGLMYVNDRLERMCVARIVKRVMEGKEGKEMRERAKNLKEKIEASVAYDGSSNNALNQLVQFILSISVMRVMKV